MVVLNRFLSQAKAYLDEDDHHKVTEERYIIILSGSEKLTSLGRIAEENIYL